jgi:mycofactocin precursor
MADEPVTTVEQTEAEESVVIDEVLVEEVSIDGMCGVY